MNRPTLLAAAFSLTLGVGVLAQQTGTVGSRTAERSPLLVDRLDALFESAPASALSEINRTNGSASEQDRRDLESWLDQRLPRFYLPKTKLTVDDVSHRSMLEAMAADSRLAAHAADLLDYARIQQAAAEPAGTDAPARKATGGSALSCIVPSPIKRSLTASL